MHTLRGIRFNKCLGLNVRSLLQLLTTCVNLKHLIVTNCCFSDDQYVQVFSVPHKLQEIQIWSFTPPRSMAAETVMAIVQASKSLTEFKFILAEQDRVKLDTFLFSSASVVHGVMKYCRGA